jgi:ketosteroid isomerase-like protein
MYGIIARRKLRQGFSDISQGKFEPLLRQFAPHIHFTFAGNHALSGDFHDRMLVKRWFDRIHRLFPGLQLVPARIFVTGLPWDMVVTTQFTVSATLPDGTPYRNEGVQVLRIRFGTIVEDHLIEDNQRLLDALQHLARLGIEEASAAPLM